MRNKRKIEKDGCKCTSTNRHKHKPLQVVLEGQILLILQGHFRFSSLQHFHSIYINKYGKVITSIINLANFAHLDVYQPFHVTPRSLPLCVSPGVEDSHQIHRAMFCLHLAREEKTKQKKGQ